MIQLSTHFTLEELCYSETATRLGINNIPPVGSFAHNRLKNLALFLEKVRHICGDQQMNIHDAYRCPLLNKAIGGVTHSAHPQGFAADFDIQGQTPYHTATLLDQAAKRGQIVFDQLILEQLPKPSWVHIGRRLDDEICIPRMERLTKAADGSYLNGIIGG